jgi:hypothetical protein
MLLNHLKYILEPGKRDLATQTIGECANRSRDFQITAEFAVQERKYSQIDSPCPNESGSGKAPIVRDLKDDHYILEKNEKTLAVGAERGINVIIKGQSIGGDKKFQCILRDRDALSRFVLGDFQNLRNLESNTSKNDQCAQQFAEQNSSSTSRSR